MNRFWWPSLGDEGILKQFDGRRSLVRVRFEASLDKVVRLFGQFRGYFWMLFVVADFEEGGLWRSQFHEGRIPGRHFDHGTT